MLDKEILELRRKLEESLTNDKNYEITYELSIELDKLITKYYNKKLMINIEKELLSNINKMKM